MTIKELLAEIKAAEKQAAAGLPITDDEGKQTGTLKLTKAQFLGLTVCIDQVRFEDMGDVHFKTLRKQAKDEQGEWKWHPKPQNAPANYQRKPVMEPVTVLVVA